MKGTTTEAVNPWLALAGATGEPLTKGMIWVTAPNLLADVSFTDTFVKTGKGYTATPSKGALVRADGMVVGEGLGKGSYGVVQASDALEWGEQCGYLGDWPLVAAGAVREGRQFYFAYYAGVVLTKEHGEPLHNYLTVVSSHDGTLPLMALHSVFIDGGSTPLCAAQFSYTDRTALKHTISIEERSFRALKAVKDNLVHTNHCGAMVDALCSTPLVNPHAVSELLPKGKGRQVLTEAVAGATNGYEVLSAVAHYEMWQAPVRNTDDGLNEAETRSLRHFDAIVRNRQTLVQKTTDLILSKG